MKVIKRNGSEVSFDIAKIIAAITKANESVDEAIRMTPMQIQRIAESVEFSCLKMNRSPSVEEIQDLVEYQIMAHGAFEVAKNYVTYRYTRSLVRRSNTTDEKILSLIECCNEEAKQENANKNPVVNSTQRDYMAGEVSRDITERILLPQEIVEAHREGIIHFHDADYFAQHMHNCDLVNLEDMLQNGTVITGTLIERPHSFATACNIATQIVAQVASNQYGGQSIFPDPPRPLCGGEPPEDPPDRGDRDGLHRRRPRRGENFRAGGDPSAGGDSPGRPDHPVSGGHPADHQRTGPLHHRVHVPQRSPERAGEDGSGHDHRGNAAPALSGCEERGRRVGHSRFPQAHLRAGGRQHHGGFPYWYLTELAAKCTARRMVPDYISEKKMQELKGDVYTCMGCRSFLTPDRFTDAGVGNIANAKNYEPGKHKYYGRFNQGVVTINLPDVALSSGGNMEKFWNIFEDRLELCHRALQCRHERLKGTLSDSAPILWQYGALARLKKGETIDSCSTTATPPSLWAMPAFTSA